VESIKQGEEESYDAPLWIWRWTLSFHKVSEFQFVILWFGNRVFLQLDTKVLEEQAASILRDGPEDGGMFLQHTGTYFNYYQSTTPLIRDIHGRRHDGHQ